MRHPLGLLPASTVLGQTSASLVCLPPLHSAPLESGPSSYWSSSQDAVTRQAQQTLIYLLFIFETSGPPPLAGRRLAASPLPARLLSPGGRRRPDVGRPLTASPGPLGGAPGSLWGGGGRHWGGSVPSAPPPPPRLRHSCRGSAPCGAGGGRRAGRSRQPAAAGAERRGSPRGRSAGAA